MLERIAHWDNLLLTYRKASRGKRGRLDVARFEHLLEENLVALRTDLLERSYRPGPYVSFYIHEPKRRLISAAPFRDRVVHHALCNIIEPMFEQTFLTDSYANRIGKVPTAPWTAPSSTPADTSMLSKLISASSSRVSTMPFCALSWPGQSTIRVPCGWSI